jgi:hypothetical protein
MITLPILHLSLINIYLIYNSQKNTMKRKISLTTGKSAEYLYTNFGKQFKKALEQNSIG